MLADHKKEKYNTISFVTLSTPLFSNDNSIKIVDVFHFVGIFANQESYLFSNG
jgi:hypothetical protein